MLVAEAKGLWKGTVIAIGLASTWTAEAVTGLI
jgi:hypothetical protein